METRSVAEQKFLDALAAALEREQFKGFDTSRVIGLVRHADNERLGATLDALIPDGRYKSGYRCGRFKDRPVRQLLDSMAERGLFTTKGPQHPNQNWWFLPAQAA